MLVTRQKKFQKLIIMQTHDRDTFHQKKFDKISRKLPIFRQNYCAKIFFSHYFRDQSYSHQVEIDSPSLRTPMRQFSSFLGLPKPLAWPRQERQGLLQLESSGSQAWKLQPVLTLFLPSRLKSANFQKISALWKVSTSLQPSFCPLWKSKFFLRFLQLSYSPS